jgi:hypothetical protein
MTEDEVLASVRRHVTEVRCQCARLHQLEARRAGAGVTELRRMARAGEPEEGTVFDLCRLLLRARDGGTLRQRWSISWEMLGGARAAACPCAPWLAFEGVPFHLGIGLRHMGLVESAEHYLSDCLEAGVWESEPYREGDRGQILAVASELVGRGPWSRPLRPDERDWLLVQVPGELTDRLDNE